MLLGLTATSPVINAGIKQYGSRITAIVTSIEETGDITEISKSLEGL